MEAVKQFVIGSWPGDYVEVVGPATDADVGHYLLKKAQVVPLPTVKLNMKMVKCNLTGDPGVEIKCSDAHLEELGIWQRTRALAAAPKHRLFQA